MTDRELLELAAKAAGIKFSEIGGGARYAPQPGIMQPYVPWNPLTDDGDALRLAVQLRIDVRIDNTTTLCYASNGLHQQACEKHTDYADPFRATRRAIVRAAAETAPLRGHLPPPA